MELCVGLDVSLEETSICVVDKAGTMQCEGKVMSQPESIAAFVTARAPGAVRIGLEAGSTSTWLWTELHALGLPAICIDARHAKAALSMQTWTATAPVRCSPAGQCWSRSNPISITRSGVC